MESHPISSRPPTARVAPARDAAKRENSGRRPREERRRGARGADAEDDARAGRWVAADPAAVRPAPGRSREEKQAREDESSELETELDVRGRQLDIRV